MKVELLGLADDFSTKSGLGIQRYMYGLYNNLHKIDSGIEKADFKRIKFLGNGPSLIIKELFKDFNYYDIVHNLMPVPFFNIKIKKRRYKLISTAHDFQVALYPEFTFDHNIVLKDKLWLKLIINQGYKTILSSDYIIAISSQTKEEAIKLGFDKRKIYLVPLGLDERFIKSIKMYKNKNTFVVGYIGALRKRKNLEFGIKASNSITNPKITFEIWGRKSFEYEYLVSISNNKNLRFKGFAPEKKLVETYDSFDVFIFPSYHEGFGFEILEAQSRGLPVIIYKYGKIPKEVRKYCFEAESPEHMAQIIENLKENGYNEKLQKEATAYARSFTWERCGKETLNTYIKALEN